ncbi:hypothetical protein I215_15566 [Galbibacter marinus]|uniref:Uncharacterized protein n=1 Tax=Galbibacter marinus TaxID=555500 RepID=K2NYI9_9FLAO|nr:hypothetical protein I215_15566 [Galbibacter marinus]
MPEQFFDMGDNGILVKGQGSPQINDVLRIGIHSTEEIGHALLGPDGDMKKIENLFGPGSFYHRYAFLALVSLSTVSIRRKLAVAYPVHLGTTDLDINTMSADG